MTTLQVLEKWARDDPIAYRAWHVIVREGRDMDTVMPEILEVLLQDNRFLRKRLIEMEMNRPAPLHVPGHCEHCYCQAIPSTTAYPAGLCCCSKCLAVRHSA